jgi:hypothetical protein
MPTITWDGLGEKVYETGIDRGVLYIPNAGVYDTGVPWNGLVGVTESPSGGEPNNQYADNIKYLTLRSAEEFNATIEAFTFPDEFAVFDGQAQPQPGVFLGQQARSSFGLSYRTKVGNDVDGVDHGYKLHLLYGCSVSPSEKGYQTINDSPEAVTFSWELTTEPAAVTGFSPVSLIVIDSVDADPTMLASLEDLLWGDGVTTPSMPTPDELITLFTP